MAAKATQAAKAMAGKAAKAAQTAQAARATRASAKAGASGSTDYDAIVVGGDQAVVPAADDDHVVSCGTRRRVGCLRSHETWPSKD